MPSGAVNNPNKPQDTEFIKNNYTVIGKAACIKILNRSSTYVYDIARSLKLKSKIIRQGKENVNLSLFTDITKPFIPYFLGLIFADGWIQQARAVCFSNITKDYNEISQHLITIGKYSETLYKKKTLNRQDQTRCSFYDIKFAKFALDNGFKDNSFNKIFDFIPEKWYFMFLRGLVDGDGCFGYYAKGRFLFNITSTYNFDWSRLVLFLKKMNIDSRIQINVSNLGKSSQLIISKRKDIVKLGRFIFQNYENDKIGFSRKFLKFIEICKIEHKYLLESKYKNIKKRKRKGFAVVVGNFTASNFKSQDEALTFREKYLAKHFPDKCIIEYLDDLTLYLNSVDSHVKSIQEKLQNPPVIQT